MLPENQTDVEEHASEEHSKRSDDFLPAGFHCLGVLGEGSSGVVYKAFEAAMQRTVAVKVLKLDSDNQEMKSKLLREARAISQLDHQNIVKLLQLARAKNNSTVLIYEYLDGVTLEQELQKGQLSLLQIEMIFSQILDGLAFIHDSGYVHRDIKPANILLCQSGAASSMSETASSSKANFVPVKILDFGIARQVLASDLSKTVTGTFRGSPAYMSPEICKTDPAQFSADLYSVACTLYKCLCGQLPFTGNTAMDLMYKHLHEAPRDLPQLNYGKEFQESMQKLLSRALSKNPMDRQANANELKQELVDAIKKRARNNGLFATRVSSLVACILGVVLLLAVGLFAIKQTSVVQPDQIISSKHGSKLPEKIGFSSVLGAGDLNAELVMLSEHIKRDSGANHGHPLPRDTARYLKRLEILATRKDNSDAQNYAIHSLIAQLHLGQGRYEDAIRGARKALAYCAPAGKKDCLQAANCLEIISRVLRAMDRDPQEEEKSVLLGEKILSNYRYHDDLVYSLDMPEGFVNPNSGNLESQLCEHLALIYLKKNQLGKAEHYLDRVTETLGPLRAPEHTELASARALLIMKQKGKIAAGQYLRQYEKSYLAIQPSFEIERNRKLRFLYDHLQDFCKTNGLSSDAAYFAGKRKLIPNG